MKHIDRSPTDKAEPNMEKTDFGVGIFRKRLLLRSIIMSMQYLNVIM